MKPEEKLQADILYWEEQERDAKEVLRYTSEMLPRLREGLLAIQRNGTRPRDEEMQSAPTSTDHPEETTAPGGVSPSQIRLTGGCGEQILQTLPNQPDLALTPNQIVENLAEYGHPYSRGAVDYNLRALLAAKKIDRVKPKRGMNAVWAYFVPVSNDQAALETDKLVG